MLYIAHTSHASLCVTVTQWFRFQEGLEPIEVSRERLAWPGLRDANAGDFDPAITNDHPSTLASARSLRITTAGNCAERIAVGRSREATACARFGSTHHMAGAVAKKARPMPGAGDGGVQGDRHDRPRRGRGRPSAWSLQLGDAICDLIADGLSLRAICERPGMPDRRTVFRWLASQEEFCHRYSLARMFQDECLEIADDASGDIIRHVTKNGREVERVNHEHLRRAKLRVATRNWMVGRLAPKKYGERLAHGFSDPADNGMGIRPKVIITIGPVASPGKRGDGRSTAAAKTPKRHGLKPDVDAATV
jgi:hypothetical protein